MSVQGAKPRSHVMAEAAAQESTVEILNSVQPKPVSVERRPAPVPKSFIEDVDSWVKQYLSLADEVLQSPAQPDPSAKKPAA